MEDSQELDRLNGFEFEELLKTRDEIDDYSTAIRRNYYVLKELNEDGLGRIDLGRIGEYLPLDDIRQNKVNCLNKESHFIEVSNGYYPDFLEDDGVFFVSLKLWQYMQQCLTTREIDYNRVGLYSEGQKRVEEYCLIVPEEIDCILEGSARYDEAGRLQYFEIDDEKTGELEIFKIKGFPRLILVDKLNRLDFSGYECVRIENFLDYEGERDRNYHELTRGKLLERAVREYETKANDTWNNSYKYGMRRVLDKDTIRRDIRLGLQAIFHSYTGKQLEVDRLCDRFFLFFWVWHDDRLELAKRHEEYFASYSFEIPSLLMARAFVATLPEEFKTLGRHVVNETFLYLLAVECRNFEVYEAIHNNQRFRLYIHETSSSSMKPLLIYDYKSEFQRRVESAKLMCCFDFAGKDLREYDFSGKNLVGADFNGCNLRRAKFHNCKLDEARFACSELTGTEFNCSKLTNAEFVDCRMDRVRFDGAQMQGVNIIGSDLCHSSFVKADLSRGRITSPDLSCVFFYKTKMLYTIIEVINVIYCSCFVRSDLRNAQFIGDPRNYCNVLEGCDFSNADLRETKFCVNYVFGSKFIKAKLNGGDFFGVECIDQCNFRWSDCLGTTLTGVHISRNDLTFVDLSKMAVMHGAIFSENDLSYTNLSGYDFRVGGFRAPNRLISTDLSNCNLMGADFSASELIGVSFRDALLAKAVFAGEQLEYNDLTSLQRKVIQVLDEEENAV